MLCKASMTVFLWPACSLAHAQQQPAPRVYTCVERMPQLPGGGGQEAILAELSKKLLLPATRVADYKSYTSGPKFSFVVTSTGQVRQARILASCHAPTVDSAVLRAVRQLPRLVPGRQHGVPVPVALTFRFSCIKFQ